MSEETNPNKLEQTLRKLVETVDVANLLAEPLTRSIVDMLRITAAELGSDEASVLVRDGDEGGLRFLAAVGRVADSLVGLAVPAGKGIAGFVFSSGQPMAVADVGEEESFYAEVDRSTGYSTQTLLATPLRHGDEIIGVLEYVNRAGEPPFAPFTPAEMDRAALFAEAIGSLVHAYESAKLLRELGKRLVGDSGEDDYAAVRKWLAELRDAPEHREMLDLAVLVRELASRGVAERRMCRELMESVLRYSDAECAGYPGYDPSRS